MTHAYDETYLNDAMCNLGEASDYAVSACGMDLDEFMQLFLASGYADRFGKGEPKLVSGISGTELALDIFARTGKHVTDAADQIVYEFRAPYWCGWILAYYQWFKGYSFKHIYEKVNMAEIEKMYPVMHEASEEKFADAVDAMIARRTTSTRLQSMRKKRGLTQAVLSERSQVNLRTLQQYETRAKDINQASAAKVKALAEVLGCHLEDLLEEK